MFRAYASYGTVANGDATAPAQRSYSPSALMFYRFAIVLIRYQNV